MNPVLKLGAMAMAPAFRIEAIRRYAMHRAVPLSIQNERYPALEAKHLNDTRLFANRQELIASFKYIRGGVIAEVGVAHGDFSEFLLDELQPEKFIAFDIFTMHEWHIVGRGLSDKDERQPAVLLDNMTHLEYYKRRFADRGTQVVVEVGRADINLEKYPGNSFDLIYIDADHSYESVKQDINVAKTKLTDSGVMVFNDYTMFDHLNGESYGVVQAVNELIVSEDWQVCGFSLQKHMFCDIAIRRRSALISQP
jgi:hypothetical protein